jgi:hypothetical protein
MHSESWSNDIQAKEEGAITYVSGREISRQSVSISYLLKTPTNVSSRDISR